MGKEAPSACGLYLACHWLALASDGLGGTWCPSECLPVRCGCCQGVPCDTWRAIEGRWDCHRSQAAAGSVVP